MWFLQCFFDSVLSDLYSFSLSYPKSNLHIHPRAIFQMLREIKALAILHSTHAMFFMYLFNIDSSSLLIWDSFQLHDMFAGFWHFALAKKILLKII